MRPFFSIVIPTLNEEKYLPRLLTDLVNQKRKNFEVVVVDASSTDKTKAKALEFKTALLIRFFQVNQENVAYSRNFGAQKARGEYLVFLDADSRIKSSFTKILKKTIDKKTGLLFIPYVIADDNDPQIKIIFSLVNFLVEFSQNLTKPFSSGGSIIIDRNFFYKLGGFDQKLFISEDHNLVQRAYQWGVKAKFLRETKVKFSLRRMRKEGQLTIFYKYLLATIHVLTSGGVKKKIFEYQMGGQANEPIKKRISLNGGLNDSLKQLKNFFRKYLT